MSDHVSHKLWGGRFSTPTAAALDALNRSIGTDYRLWPFDINLSQAWGGCPLGGRSSDPRGEQENRARARRGRPEARRRCPAAFVR